MIIAGLDFGGTAVKVGLITTEGTVLAKTEMAFDRLQGESGNQIRSQSPMNRVASPKEVAEAVFMMSKANIWMTGGIFDVNGASYFRT